VSCGKIVMMQTHGESPMKDQVPADWHDKVIHARLPFQKTFWSPGFGMLVDRFGIPWMVNCEPTA
jgi:uncharacterized glyoxalase superfamily protein PhnB